MATLNLSTNGPSISKSYQSVVSSPAPSGAAANSPTYGQWAVFSVSTPLVNAFQQDAGGKESVLKVQSTGEGELVDLIEEFSDGRVQFAFAKVKDPNTGLQKYVLVGWCGEGVPERTKGYFTSHLAAVSKVLQGYHVQITARSDRDLTPEGIVRKVSDASGSRYSSGAPTASSGPPPPVSSKPAFTPTRSSGGGAGYNPLGASRQRAGQPRDGDVDEDGWGQDAPPVTRTQLEKVPSSYQPTKVNFKELTSQKPEPSRFNGNRESDQKDQSDVVKGAYQPVGKVDIAALRRQAQDSGSKSADRPEIVKGSYEPVGKVDIAAIRARAQRPSEGAPPSTNPTSAAASSGGDGEPKSLSDRSAAFSTSERMTSLPRPKVANRFSSSTTTFAGTKAPTPGGFGRDSKPAPAPTPVGTASRTFADQGGKTPAQQWAEKKARERGLSGAGDKPPPTGFGGPTSPIASQASGGGEWKSGYAGKSWAPVPTTHTGRSASSSSIGQQRTGQDEESQQQEAPTSPAAGISAIRDRFKDAPPMGASATGASRSAPSPPPLDTSSKPNAGRGIPIPGLPTRPAKPTNDEDEEEEHQATRLPTPPPQPPRSPTPPTPPAMRSSSPIRVAMPVSRNPVPEIESAREEQFSPPPAMPMRSLANAVPDEDELTDAPHGGYDPARAAAEATAVASFGQHAVETANPGAGVSGKRALVQYDYEKAEDNEIELREGEYVTNIEMVDEDWWAGQNAQGEMGLFPSNYVELVEGEEHGHGLEHEDVHEHQHQQGGHEHAEPAAVAGSAHAGAGGSHGPTATALYDYEAAEENELSFPEGAKITSVSFPDEDWWMGEYEGDSGLFPANYVQLDE